MDTKISACVLVKELDESVLPLLGSLHFCGEILLNYTSPLTKAQEELLKPFPCVTITQIPFQGFGKTRNLLHAQAKYPWILAIDSDEWVPEKLQSEILQISLDKKNAYFFKRRNFYKNRWVFSCGWYPDCVGRLFHKEETSFKESAVHEALDVEHLSRHTFKAPLHHTPIRHPRDFLQKIDSYAELASIGKKNIKNPFLKASTHGLFAFLYSFIARFGFLQGSLGFEISLYKGLSSYYKYLYRAKE